MISFFTGSGGAGIIRGEQIAKRLGANLNATGSVKVNDVCIYVKREPPKDYPPKTYIDVVEDSAGLRWAYKHPEIGIIASSRSIYNILRGKFSNIHFIPQHHCNFDKEVRTRKDVKVAGIIGNKMAFQYNLPQLKDRLKGVGIELKTLIKKRFTSRQEVVDFYKEIDIQLIWRPNSDGVLRNPLKLANACSFGIPTVAYPEVNFRAEFGSRFISAYNIDDMITGIMRLKKFTFLYKSFALQGLEKAEEYHIDSICKLYKALDG